MSEVEREFEAFVEDLEAQMAAASIVGGLGDDDREELRELVQDYRSRIRGARDEAAARERLSAFKEKSARFGQGAGMP